MPSSDKSASRTYTGPILHMDDYAIYQDRAQVRAVKFKGSRRGQAGGDVVHGKHWQAAKSQVAEDLHRIFFRKVFLLTGAPQSF